jgi:hypothetical protein
MYFLDATVTFRGCPFQVVDFINSLQTGILLMTISVLYGDIKEHHASSANKADDLIA